MSISWDALLACVAAFAAGWTLADRRLRRRFIITDRARSQRETRTYLDQVEAYANTGREESTAEAALRAVLAEEAEQATDGLILPPPPWEKR